MNASTTEGRALHLDPETFDSAVRNAKGVALVDFWASWCPPCRAIAPTIDRLASRYSGQAVIGKVDVDAGGELASAFGVRSIPTLVFFKDGKEVDRIVGVVPEETLAARLDDLIG